MAGGDASGPRGVRTGRSEHRAAFPRLPLLHQGAEAAPLLFFQLQETVAGPLAPDGHVFPDAGVVPQDLQEVPGLELAHLPRRQEDGQRAEGAGDVQEVPVRGQVLASRSVRRSEVPLE